MTTTKKLLVGITGSLGAGKSTLSRIYETEGYAVFSADAIAREVVAPGSAGLAEITARFGPSVLRIDGSLDRAVMRELIARDPSQRKLLEAITHPRIQARSRELAEAEFAKGAALVFYEAPLLFEAKSETNVDAVICVAAREDLRIARVQARDGVSAAQAKALIDAQLSQEEKIRRSDYVVWNDGNEATLNREAHAVLAQILGTAP